MIKIAVSGSKGKMGSRIIDLAKEAVKADGSIDPELISFRQIELKEAVAEAESYEEATGEAVKCIKILGHF